MIEDITLIVEKDEDTNWFVAIWDDPRGGGITTQGKDLADLQANVKEAVQCYFETDGPHSVRLHFVNDPVLLTA